MEKTNEYRSSCALVIPIYAICNGNAFKNYILMIFRITPLIERRYEKSYFLHMLKQRRRSAARFSVQLISAFIFTTQIVQSLLMALSLLHTNMLLYPYCYHTKKERTDPGTSLDRVDFELDR